MLHALLAKVSRISEGIPLVTKAKAKLDWSCLIIEKPAQFRNAQEAAHNS
jgi:hypothetical protein